MHLVNFPKVRIKKYSKGYSVEVQKTKRYFLFWSKKYWIHIEAYSGLDHLPFYYKDKQSAIDSATLHFKWDLLFYS